MQTKLTPQEADPAADTDIFANPADPVAYPTPTNPPAGNPFDPANLRLSQAFVETAGVKKQILTVPVRKPSSQEFVRVHPGAEYRENFAVLTLKDERVEDEIYLVTKDLVPELVGEIYSVTMFTAINRQGTPFLWPTRLPPPDGKDLDWWRTGREAAALAMKHWVRVKSNTNLCAYDVFIAESAIAEPEWPALSFWDLVQIAFRNRLIDRTDHPVIKQLRGLA
jgi:hypothetical protein